MTESSLTSRLQEFIGALDHEDGALFNSEGEVKLSVLATEFGPLTRAQVRASGAIRRIAEPEPVADGIDTTDEQTALENLAEAARQVNLAKDTERLCSTRLIRARAGVAKALADFISGQPQRNAADVHRENVARQQARKLAVANGEIEAPVTALPEFRSAIDAQAFHSKGGSVNGGKYNAFRRGGSPTKLPSQR